MKETVTGKIIWNKAASSALALAAVPILASVASRFISGAAGGGGSFLLTILTMLLWVTKVGVCIWLMAFFMKRLVSSYDEVTGRDTRRYGMAIALLSALLVAGYNLADMLLIHPGFWQEQFSGAFSQMSSMMDSNTREALQDMEGSMPAITFFTNLVYCFLYGTVLSAILSRSIPPQDPFAGFRDKSDNPDNN